MSNAVQDIEAQLQQLKAEAEAALKDTDAVDLATLDELRIRFLGRKEGRLTHIKRGLKDIPDSERPRIGSLANEVSEAIEGLITQKQQHLKEAALNDRLKELGDREYSSLQKPFAPDALIRKVRELLAKSK